MINLHLNFKHIKITEALKTHIEKKVAKFEKFVTYPMEVHVILSVEKTLHTAEVTCHAEHRHLVALVTAKDMYESIDLVCHKIEAQLKKERDRKKGHSAANTAKRPAAVKLASDVKADLPHREKKPERSSNT